jgi:hypothetical protein
MSEAKLHSLSQGQLMYLHIKRLEARLAKAWTTPDAETKQSATGRAAEMLGAPPIEQQRCSSGSIKEPGVASAQGRPLGAPRGRGTAEAGAHEDDYCAPERCPLGPYAA